MSERRQLWRSADGGRTWQVCYVLPTSIVGSMTLPLGTVWTDGFGNAYRSDPPDADHIASTEGPP